MPGTGRATVNTTAMTMSVAYSVLSRRLSWQIR